MRNFNSIINNITIFFSGSLFAILTTDFIFKSQYSNFKQSVKDENYLYILNRLKISSKFKNCMPSRLKELPKNSVIIIGNAYGTYDSSTKRNHNGLPDKLELFLEKNKSNIQTVIFSGDVFVHPSRKKWESLFYKYKNAFEIVISPGDLDVGGIYKSSQLDIFKRIVSMKQNSSFPFIIKRERFNIVIDNSNNKINYIKQSLKLLNEQNIYKDIIIIRHHVPIANLRQYKTLNRRDYVWSPFKIHKKYKPSYIEDRLDGFTNVNFIYGDSIGLNCYTHNSISHFTSGLSNKSKYNILVLNDLKINSYIIE